MDTVVADAKISEITEKIVQEYRPEKIILFGSWAWGNPRPDSDIDLFVIKNSNQNSIERMRDVQRIIFGKGIPADVLVYTPAQIERRMELGDPFVKKILTSGKVLYARN